MKRCLLQSGRSWGGKDSKAMEYSRYRLLGGDSGCYIRYGLICACENPVREDDSHRFQIYHMEFGAKGF